MKDTIVSAFVKTKQVVDGWVNVLTGLNSVFKDARMAATVRWRRMTEPEIEDLYAGDAIASKVVDLPVEEATQKGYKITGLSDADEDKVLTRLKELFFDQTIVEAARKSRLYGGAAILKGYDDDLMLDKPKPEGKALKSLVVFQRFELYATWEDVQKDILHPEFGCPMRYNFQGRNAALTNASSIKIHYSRLVRFEGAWLPDKLRQSNGYWNDTVLSKPYDAIRNYSHAHESVNAALKDLSVAVFKMKNLADQMGADCDDKVIKRMEIVNMTKSIARAVVIDAEGEDFDYKTRNLSGAGEIVDRSEGRVAAETGFPRTVLFGESPKGGLGQSGDHESENWYSWVETYQKTILKPHMLEIVTEVCQELGIATDDLEIEFNPLFQQSEKQIVENRNKQADTDTKYIDMQVLDPSEVRESRFGSGKYSIETKVDTKFDLAFNRNVKPPVEDPATDPAGNPLT